MHGIVDVLGTRDLMQITLPIWNTESECLLGNACLPTIIYCAIRMFKSYLAMGNLSTGPEFEVILLVDLK